MARRHKDFAPNAVCRKLPPFATLACVLLAVLVPETAQADIYRCRQADGTFHFTNAEPNQASRSRCTRVVRESPRRRTDRRSNAAPRPFAERDTSPERFTRFDAYIREASLLYELPEAFIRAVIKVESDYNPGVVSHAGAMGLMQLMPRTATSVGVRDAFDPRQNILGGTRYLRILANNFNGDLILTIAAYNAGEGAVTRHRGVPPYEETRRYVRRVLTNYYQYRQAASAPQ